MAMPVRWSWSEDSDAAGEGKRQATNADIRRRNCPIPRRMPMARRGWRPCCGVDVVIARMRSEEHTSELQSLMRISYAVFCLKTKNTTIDAYDRYKLVHSCCVE